MIKIKNVTMKNFMSVGEVTQAVKLNDDPLSLILGENRDLGGSGNRNGVGKSTIINAITYALYGAALTKIKLPNLINKTNGKKMLVTLEFSKNGTEYRIERGRGAEVFRLFVDGTDHYDNDSQGDSRLTQKDVEAVLGMDKVLFSNIVALNTFSEPFLSMSASKQREMMELLLGMTKLSEKATSLKDEIKDTKEELKEEEFRIKGIKDSNSIISGNIDTANKKLASWNKDHENNINSQAIKLSNLDNLDVDEEISKHKEIEKIDAVKKEVESVEINIINLDKEANILKKDISQCKIDIKRTESEKNNNIKHAEDALMNAKNHQATIDGMDAKRKDLNEMLSDLEDAAKNVQHDSECPTCGQSVEGDKHEELVAKALRKVSKCKEDISQCDVHEAELLSTIKDCGAKADEYSKLALDCDPLIAQYESKIVDLESHVTLIFDEITKLSVVISELTVKEKPTTFYATLEKVYEHKSKIDVMARDLENEMAKVNPYIEQVDVLNESLQEVVYDLVERLTSLREHQDFLLKLLTNKDSFIRKKIIDQNLAFLNERLRFYLESIGLPHAVVFNPNLDVHISEYGRDLDFDNLSRGEKTRLILSLSWAFRDIYESMNGSINLLFIDELLDSGLDASGTESTLAALKVMAHDQNKNVMLISHREELVGKVDNIITVCKENGFTKIESSEL